MHAELAYVFRHALLRAAAYELQLPAERASLHALALHALELALAGAPEALDAAARELADHAALGTAADATLGEREVHWLMRAVKTARAGYRHDAEAECLQRLLPHPHTTPAQRRNAVENLAHNRARLGRTQEAVALFEQALQAATDAGDTRMELDALTGLGQALRHLREFQRAEDTLRRAESRASHLGDTGKVATAQVMLGVLCEARGRAPEAAACYASALAAARECGDTKSEELALGNRANLHLNAGELDQAQALYATALDIATTRNDPRTQAIWTGNLGLLHGKQDRFELAEQLIAKSIQLSRQAGDHRNEATMLLNLCSGLLEMGRWQDCRAQASRALEIARELQLRGLEAGALEYLGRVELFRNDPAAAELWLVEAREAALASRNPREIGLSTGLLGVARLALGKAEIAREHLQEALAQSRAGGDLLHAAHWVVELAILARKLGQEADAMEQWKHAESALLQAGDEGLAARMRAKFAAASRT